MRYKIIVPIVISLLAASTAHAQNWETSSQDYTFNEQKSGVKPYTYKNIRTATTNTAKPEIRISCAEKSGLSVTLFLTPRDTKKTQARTTGLGKRKYQIVFSDGRKHSSYWTHSHSTKTYQTRDQKTAVILYNAILAGKSFVFMKTTFDPPSIDEGFREFIDICPRTKL